MRILLAAAALAAVLALGCASGDPEGSAGSDLDPTPDAGEKIREMDFESGEIEEESAEPQEPAAEATPVAP